MKAKNLRTLRRDRMDLAWDNCYKYRIRAKNVMAYWTYRYFDNKEAQKHMFPGCIIEYKLTGTKCIGNTSDGFSIIEKGYTEFQTMHSEEEISFYCNELGNAEKAKRWQQYEIISVFEQNEETSEMKLLWNKPIPEDHYTVDYERKEKER